MPYAQSAGAAQEAYKFDVKVGSATLSGTTISDTGTTNSAKFNPGPARRIGLALYVSAVTGTTPTITPSLQWTPDVTESSPVWYSLPQSANSQTQAAMAAITSASKNFEWYECPVPAGGGVRVVLDHTGASSDAGVTFGDSYWIVSLL